MNAQDVLSTHRISVKTIRRRHGAIDQCFSIQFTYPKGKKQQFVGKTEDEVRQKVYRFFNVSCMTFQELYDRWQNDQTLTEAEKKKMQVARYGYMRYVEALSSKIAADVTPEEILLVGKAHIASGCKTGSANTQIRNIVNMYAYGISRGLLTDNPALGVKRFRAQETQYERNYLTDRQIYEFLTVCKEMREYIFAVFFICGIDLERFVPLRWKDIDFGNHRIDINRKMADRKSFEIVELERTDKIQLEEPAMAFEYLELELKKQAEALEIPRSDLLKSSRVKIIHPNTDHITSRQAFSNKLDDLLRRKLVTPYKMGDIGYTSAVFAFKAECDLPSVASIVGNPKAMEMFRNPEKYDLYTRTKNRSVNDYFDELYFGKSDA